ncbi:MAG TPA: peptidase M12 [Aquabacterium sp.]|nr:peptidase M12 [Aquabacterium sp.]
MAKNAYVGCTIRELPEHLAEPANQTAIRINPANRPRLQGLTALLDAVGVALPAITTSVQRIAVARQNYWGSQGVKLTVSFLDTSDQALIKKILAFANKWGKHCNAEFVWTQRDGQVRIARQPGGYWSYLGTDILHIPADQPTMNLEAFTVNTADDEYERVVCHEFGHTLGCPHEHMRPEIIDLLDHEKVYDYFWRTQGWSRAVTKQQVLTSLREASIMGTPHAEHDSIMCYGLPGTITKNGKPISGGMKITDADGAFMNTLYPKAMPAPPPVEPVEASAGIATVSFAGVSVVIDQSKKKVAVKNPPGWTRTGQTASANKRKAKR